MNDTMADDLSVDPAIAAAMGFTGFGAQPGKPRKFDPNDAFVDPSLGTGKDAIIEKPSQPHGKGANSLPLGARKSVPEQSLPSTTQTEIGADFRTAANAGTGVPEPASVTAPAVVDPQALRQGFKNDRGDMVYFLPSFIEDPVSDGLGL